MYTVSKGPSKIVAKTRRGLSQNFDRIEKRRDLIRKSSESDGGEVIINMPKPVFHSNGKKTVHQRIQQDVITPQHEEMIRYINSTWNQIYDSEPSSPTDSNGSISPIPQNDLYYRDFAPSPVLHNFKPFDLETWWGKRLFQNITNSL